MATVSDKLAIEGGEAAVSPGRHRRWPDSQSEDHDAISGVLDSGELWGAYATQVTALQEEWSAFCGVRHTLAVNSGLPLPVSPIFRGEKVQPWQPGPDDEQLRPWEPERSPVASQPLDQSLVLGPEHEPLYVQDINLMHDYVDAIGKVMSRIEAVLELLYEPVRVRPPIPSSQL